MAAPKSFLLASVQGDGLSLAQRLQREGHRVAFYASEPKARNVGRGIVPLTTALSPQRGDTIVFTGSKMSRQARFLRRQGFAVIGGNSLEEVELNRTKGFTLMTDNGIAVPESYSFLRVAEAIRFLSSHDGEWFLKPDDAPAYMTMDAQSSETTQRLLSYVEPHLKKPGITLQRRVSGTEIDVDVWWNGKDRVAPNTLDLEEKRFNAGNIGLRTGCESNVVFAARDGAAKLREATIERFYDALATTQYVGCFSINCVITPGGDVYGLEFTARFGYDALEAWMQLNEGDLGEQLIALANGELDEWDLNPSDPFAMTLRLSVPPYPNEGNETQCTGLPLAESLRDDPKAYLWDVMVTDNGLVCAGTYGQVGVLVESGPYLPHLRATLVERARDLDIPGLQYRIDPVDSAEKRIDTLREAGLLDVKPGIATAVDFAELREQLETPLRHREEDDSDDEAQGEHVTTGGAIFGTSPTQPGNLAPTGGGGSSPSAPGDDPPGGH